MPSPVIPPEHACRTAGAPPGHRARVAANLACVAAIAAGVATLDGCADGRAVLLRQIEARQRSSELRVAFLTAEAAAMRAVLADTPEASAAAAEQARESSDDAARLLDSLDSIVQSLGYQTEAGIIDRLEERFDEVRRLDDEILPLASEGTNVAAQRLSFTTAQKAVDRFMAAIDPGGRTPAMAGAINAARADVLEIQVLEARHIAEADQQAMADIEARMDALASRAGTELARASRAGLDAGAAQVALDAFLEINRQIVGLSRRNTNVRSLALTMGRKRVVAAACEDDLQALDEAVAKHGTEATR
jgi:hypothetical protein